MNRNLKVNHYSHQSKMHLPVIAVAKIVIKDNSKTKDYYECTIELDERCLRKLDEYISHVIRGAEPLTPKDLGFFLQGILSNIVEFSDEFGDKCKPAPCSYIAGQNILKRYDP
ncbi:MAG: hypothetical protein V3W44_09865 [Dehalococcoidales bacterium]